MTSATTATGTNDGVLIRAENIVKTFKKAGTEIPVLRGVTLNLQAGEMVALAGPSGVGKSTLLHIIGTLDSATSGRVLFGPQSQDLSKYSEKALSVFRNRALGFIFQFHYLLPEFSALENVMMPALIAGYPREASEKQARELLQFVGLAHRVEHRPTELSGGEQQRVAIARSVILRPKLLLADEPTGNLDSVNSGLILDLLTQLNQSTGVAVLLVTHDRDIARKMHRTVTMRDGLIV